MKTAATAILFTSLLTGTALSADLPARMPVKAVPYLATFNWTGAYVGVNAGYGWTRSMNGVVGGGQIGYNWQVSNLVLGLEADIQGSGQRGSRTVTDTTGALNLAETNKINYFGTVRARLGFAQDRWLAYVTGGLAYTRVNRNGTDIAGVAGTYSANDSKTGFALGLGVEYAFTQAWSAKLEYLYLGYNGSTNTYATLAPVSTVSYGRLNDNIVRVGLNYHF